ncbi:MAG: glycosyltransferase family 2 protein [Planctomycetota bacterium]
MDVTIVTEAYNLAEGQGLDELETATNTVLALIEGHDDREGIVLAPGTDPRVEALVKGRHPRLRLLYADGAGYDALKDLAADEARGTFIAYLDGDCVPTRADWLEQLLGPLRRGETDVAAGLTTYAGSDPLSAACSVLDFGFLLSPEGSGSIGCYASNNVAFPAELRRRIRPSLEVMRCNCYQHAQLLLRQGYRIRCFPEAFALHQLPDLRKERFRRGYDLVAACWINPALPEAAWMEPGEATVSRLIRMNLEADRERLGRLAAHLGWRRRFTVRVGRLLPRLRRLDAIGIRRALRDGEASGATRAARDAQQAGQSICATGMAMER